MTTRITHKPSNRWTRCCFKSRGRYPCAHIPPTGSPQEVTAVFVRESDHINYLTFLDVYGNEQVIETTDEHPFWVVTDDPDWSRAASGYFDGTYHAVLELDLLGFWVEAKDLQEGDVFIGANGEWSVLLNAERVEFPDGVTVYNFTVDGNHNYFVIAATDEFGQTCILVHNADSWYKQFFWGSSKPKKVDPSSYKALVGNGPGAANMQNQINMGTATANHTNALADEAVDFAVKRVLSGHYLG